jgi:hypothetical protein
VQRAEEKKGDIASMATEKDRNFIDFILEKTRSGKAKWEATAAANEFTTSVKGKYKVVVRQEEVSSGFNTSTVTFFSLRNVDDQELVGVPAGEYTAVRELYELARRNALSVDAVLDEIMGDKDDLPF